MTEVVDTPSAERQELLRYILDDDTLAYVEEKFPGVVRIRLCRRTRAVVVLKLQHTDREQEVSYHLPEEDDHGNCTLEINARYSRKLQRDHPDLWSFARHRAAEAMLALRNGHKEYMRVRKRQRQSPSDEADVP